MTLATRLNGVLAVVGTIPSGVGPDLLCGELRTDDDQPYRPPGSRPSEPRKPLDLLVAPNTERGLGLILTTLTRLASQRRQAS